MDGEAVKPEKVFLEINWNLLTLFAGLFVVVGAAREAGLTERIFEVLHAREAHSPGSLTALSAVLSNLVSNVPAVMLFIPLVPQFPDPERAWLICDDPAHGWVRGTWADQEIDPRLPLTGTTEKLA